MKASIDFAKIDPKSRSCESFPTSLATSAIFSCTHYYTSSMSTFRKSFEQTTGVELSAVFQTCNSLARIQIQVDDSSLIAVGNYPIIYFDDSTQEFVFVGGYDPPPASYSVLIQASIQEKATFTTHTFEFNLVVGSSFSSECIELTPEPEPIVEETDPCL